ncbi:hypothetical protein AVEN_137796-1 [Araneus ventricosus]|uniref:Uncharacterized protein n=1 Tax=Araneus ventricosus TaxID=182803 RepID=A0A4Y2SWG0_ARAVE|nr:hypothetical protein AVEN_137796-1 [Araneus ventricosus]
MVVFITARNAWALGHHHRQKMAKLPGIFQLAAKNNSSFFLQKTSSLSPRTIRPSYSKKPPLSHQGHPPSFFQRKARSLHQTEVT